MVPAAQPRDAQRIKVLYVMDALHAGERVGGTEGQLLQLIASLDRETFDPHLVVFRTTPYVEAGGALPCPVTVLNVGKLASAGSAVRLLRLARRVRRDKFDLVHAFLTDASLVAPLVGLVGGAPVITSRRDMGFWYTPRALRALRVVNRFVSRVVANSDAVRRNVHECEGYPLDRIDVVYNGHDPARFETAPLAGLRERLGIGPSDPVIGMVANLNPWKRQEDLLSAFTRIQGRHPRAHLMLVGTGPSESALRQAARSLRIERHVHFLGGIADAVPIVKHFTAAVLCSESEGLSNAVIEYLACGKPVVCSEVGGNPEIVAEGQSGFLIAPGDVDTLAARLDFLLSSPDACDRMGREGRRIAERLTSRRMAASHMDLYARLASKRLRGPRQASTSEFEAPAA